MNNYLNNNILLINEYEKMYFEGVDINKVLEKFRSNGFDNYSAFDYGRFRVFLDSCLLLMNKEKLNMYMKNSYSYINFLNLLENDKIWKQYCTYLKSGPFNVNTSKLSLFSSTTGKEKSVWDQVATIRNAFAHMQYGNFVAAESGMMIFFGIYNKDKGIKKDEGIVFEPILHEFIKMFFSNYSFGISYKATFFSNYSLKKNCKTKIIYFYIVKAKKNSGKIINGYSNNILSELIKNINTPGTDVIEYIKSNQSMYEIEEYEIGELINIINYNRLVEKYHINTSDKYYYGLKTFLDFETEISNFLVHIAQLNSILYDYYVLKKNGHYTNEYMKVFRMQIEKLIQELSEDESATLAFEIGFVYLKIMNFALRTEDDDYVNIEYSMIDVYGFEFDEDALKKYIEEKKVTDFAIQKYVIERMRNALMHGNINCEVTEKGDILIVFNDNYNKRKDEIKILLKDLKCFLAQDILYVGVPILTEVLLMDTDEID